MKKKILLLDDEIISLKRLENGLKNYKTVSFQRAEPALSHVQSTPETFGLIITDRIMPGMDALAFMKALEEDIPVVIQTGEMEKVDQIELIQAGVSDFLMKPVEEVLLQMVVRRLLKHDEQ